MGSSGSGTFSDYSRHRPTNPDFSNGGSSGIDKCALAFSTSLEEVGRCFYYINRGILPPSGTEVVVVFNGVRLAAETDLGEEIGYLPTAFNYIKNCIDDGFAYRGIVRSYGISPTPTVFVDITPL